MTGIDRRSLLPEAAALIVTFSLPRRAVASVRTVAADSVDGYLSVAPDGAVTVFAGMVDLGTGAARRAPPDGRRRARSLAGPHHAR